MESSDSDHERSFYHLKDSLGREPTPQEVRQFMATFIWIKVPIRKGRVI